MIAWYRTVFGAHIVHEDPKLAFLTWDKESHRLALVKVPRLLRYLFPLARLRRKIYGVDHLGFTIGSLEQLLSTYDRLKKAGITPVWSINHGPTTSLYYEDPDGIRLEFQVRTFPPRRSPRSTSTAAPSPRIPSGSILTPTIYLSGSAAAQTHPNYSSKELAPAQAPRHDAPSRGRRSDQKPSTSEQNNDCPGVRDYSHLLSTHRGRGRGQLPQVGQLTDPGGAVLPDGGISTTNAHQYLALPNVGCVGGSWLTPSDVVASGNGHASPNSPPPPRRSDTGADALTHELPASPAITQIAE